MNTIEDSGIHTKECKLTRKEILAGGYKWREGLIPLSLSLHAKRRIEERVDGEFPIVPKICRITKENICSGRTKDGKHLSSVKIRLDYKKDKWMFLVICPGSGIVKTLFINYKNAKREQTIKEREGITEEICCIEEETFTEAGEFGGGGIDAFLYAKPMGSPAERETLLGMWWKDIWGKFIHILGPSSREERI